MGKYLQEQKVYAELYGQTTRTIKRWIATGRAAGEDLPPLDWPARMPDWWARHYRHRVPDAILDAAKAAPGQPELPHAVSAGTSAAELGTGFAEMLERVKRAEAEAHRNYMAVIKDESRAPAARKVWGELAKQLRELERDGHDILRKSGAVLDRATAEIVLAEIHLAIASGIRSMWRRVRPRMKLAGSDIEEDRIWQEECDRLLFRLNDSAFRAAEAA